MDALKTKWVMACVDGSPFTDTVVDYAAWIAETVGSPLELMHTIEPTMLLDNVSYAARQTPNMREATMQDLSEQERAENKRQITLGKDLLEAQKNRLEGRELPGILLKQRHGDLASALTDIEDSIRVLVVGLRGQGHQDSDHQEGAAIGEQLEATIKALHKPIFIVNGDFVVPKQVMLAYNDTAAARKALAFICESPLYADMTIHLVHVNDKPHIGQPILDAAAVSLQRAGRTYQISLLSGDAQTALLTYQQTHNIELIVMGALTHGALHQLFFGSMALKILQHTKTSVLLIR